MPVMTPISELPNTLTDRKKEALLETWKPRNFDVMEYVVRIARAWKLLLLFAVLGAIAGAAYKWNDPRFYVSVANFMPPPAELNSTATAGTSLSILSASLQGDTYLYLMRTRTLTTDVVKRTGLAAHLKMDPETARAFMMQRVTFDVQRSAVVTVMYRDPDPQWAAKVVNGYIDALYRMEGMLVTSAYSHRREFFEDQIKIQRDKLEQAEDTLVASQQKLGVLSPEGAGGVEQGQEIGLQSQIDATDTQLNVLLKSQTEQSPAVIALRNQRNALAGQLARQKNSGLNPSRGIQGLRGLPVTILQQNRRARDVAERNTVYQGILSRYQLAQAAEVDPGPQFEVIDGAIPAPEPEPSPVPKWTVIGAALGVVLSIVMLMSWPVLDQLGRSFVQRVRTESAGKPGREGTAQQATG